MTLRSRSWVIDFNRFSGKAQVRRATLSCDSSYLFQHSCQRSIKIPLKKVKIAMCQSRVLPFETGWGKGLTYTKDIPVLKIFWKLKNLLSFFPVSAFEPQIKIPLKKLR